jgi:hypothetical protein
VADAVEYSKCWANALGDCAGGMTLEHLIARSQFGDVQVTVQGYPWCKDEPRTVGIGGVAARILCRHHNNTSSPLDDTALKTLEAFRTIAERADRLKASGRPERRLIVRIPGDRLERWVLKTTINLALQGRPAPTGGIFDGDGRPGRRFVEIVYGRGLFEAREGLSWVAEVGDKIQNADQGTISFSTLLRKDDGALVASMMMFHGYKLFLATVDAPQIENAVLPLRTFQARGSNVRVEFEYSDARNRVLRGRPPRGSRRR